MIQSKLFEGLTAKQRKYIEDHSKRFFYEKGEYLHFNGDKCDFFEIILAGKVEVEHISEEGDKLILWTFLQQYFGLSPSYY